MKTLKLLLTMGLLAFVTNVSAQFANATAGRGSSAGSRFQLVNNTENYSRITVSYVPMKMQVDVDDAEDMKVNGVSVGYTYGLNILRETPLFVQFGANLLYGAGKQSSGDDEWSYEEKLHMLSLNVPVSISYKLGFSEKIFVTPYVGLNFRGNLLASGEYTDSYSSMDGEYFSETYKWNYFDKDEAGDGKWNRFQVGWRLGVGLDYKRLYVGIAYGKDFSELFKKGKVSVTTISIGYNF